ncbi:MULTISPECIES: SDR family NAD(P)-dependent oxidoreductase [Achromobacter]|jgi:NAD(P)-dependent dehydrogenase (short-subunit alcohol dehydrogenase family)|uniref:Short chain dehydrogenase family protein 65 n=2 Tax=Achromobacter TaxID=222 RepID=E3HXZ3_ACHXA|nr:MULTISPECIES: SDR family oxidoreductase [Achromobacter]ADP19947.1 short chain dehydrogenase family protein 65 [Achromobacter xylosoxidans A8]AVG44071.1 KR domain-containing protein [Achromobacter insolitus]CAB3848474.1 Dihydroanticapsin 7-dehydrogenase [Achromobacter aegrifaciens]CAB3911650.1 Dihydroanticapsin 7-dehydrogenase [Achromobacter mucicolens]
MQRLEGKVAFITGGGAGIGRASALLFAKEGAQVVIAERDTAAGEQTAAMVEASTGRPALFIHTDVTEPESLEEAVKRTVAQFGRFDVLYNNAGGSTVRDSRVTDAPVEEFWSKMKLDLFGTWLGCRYGIQAMMDAGNGGSVINSTSIFALIGTHGKDAYTAAKGAVSALTRSMAVEYAQYRIRVNAVAPGATATERVLKLLKDDGVTSKSLEGQFFGLVQPEDIAHAALYLASDESRSTTGHILAVDGGLTIS